MSNIEELNVPFGIYTTSFVYSILQWISNLANIDPFADVDEDSSQEQMTKIRKLFHMRDLGYCV